MASEDHWIRGVEQNFTLLEWAKGSWVFWSLFRCLCYGSYRLDILASSTH